MKYVRWTRAIPVLLLAQAIFICASCLQGCTESASSGAANSYIANASDRRFEMGTDRPPTAKTLYAMADILATQGKDKQAEFILQRIIQEYPEFLPARNHLAELQMRQRRINEAIKTISDGLRTSPRDPVLLNNLGMCWLVRGKYEKALEMFTEAAGVMPENTKYRANMATALGLMGRYEETLSLYKQVLPHGQANHNLSVLRQARNNAISAVN